MQLPQQKQHFKEQKRQPSRYQPSQKNRRQSCQTKAYENNIRHRSSNSCTIGGKWQRYINCLTDYERFTLMDFSYPLDFYYHLQKMIEKGFQIRLNIPLTLTGVQDNCLKTVFKQHRSQNSQNHPFHQQIGTVEFTPIISKNKFQNIVEKQSRISRQRLKNKGILPQQFLTQHDDIINSNTMSTNSSFYKNFWIPFVVVKQKIYNNNHTIDHCITLENSYEFKKMATIDAHQIAQNYIFPKGKVISITRFFYYPDLDMLQHQQHQNKRKNHRRQSAAYKIDNQQNPFNLNNNKRISKQFWKVREHKQKSINYVKVMFQNKSFYQQTVNLIDNLQKYTQKKITKIVTDWILDVTTQKYFLIDVKQTRFIEPVKKFRVRKSLTELLATVTCPMCQKTYHPSEMSKSLTSRLIIEFYENLQNRGVQLSFKVNCNWKKKSDVNQVCDLCYKLVVQENQLKETARMMAMACNYYGKQSIRKNGINSQNDGFQGIQKENQVKQAQNVRNSTNTNSYIKNSQQTLISTKKTSKNYEQLNLYKISQKKCHKTDNSILKDYLYQWRIFFFLEQIKNFDNIIKNFKKQISFIDLLNFNGPLYLNIKMQQTLTSFMFRKCDNPQIKGIKIQYLFTEDDDIANLLQKSEIQIQISVKPGWNRPIAEGCLRRINEKEEQNQQFSQRKYKEILLFGQSGQYCILGMYIGVVGDGQKKINKQKIKLKRLQQTQAIYKSNGQFIDATNLPAEWMQIIDPVYSEGQKTVRTHRKRQRNNRFSTRYQKIDNLNKKILMQRPQRSKLVL